MDALALAKRLHEAAAEIADTKDALGGGSQIDQMIREHADKALTEVKAVIATLMDEAHPAPLDAADRNGEHHAVYGDQIERSQYNPYRSVIADPENAPAGNVVLRVGRELEGGGWSQTEHVVMRPIEARVFAAAVETAANSGLKAGESR